jgi:hypothetical protein
VRSTAVTLIAFVVICAGALGGFALKKCLQANHLDSTTQDTVKLATGIVATLTALVLGLLIASAKQTFDGRGAEVRSFVINLTLLDRAMREYDPPLTKERQVLADFARTVRVRLWGPHRDLQVDALAKLDEVRNAFRDLDPRTPHNKSLHTRFMALSATLILAGNELVEGEEGAISGTIVVIVDVWLVVIFVGFALFAPFNRVSVTAMIVSAAAVAMALFLIVEMNSPFRGYVNLRPGAMDRAIAEISK